MPARERRVARRAKRRNQARTQDRRAYATEPLLERHIRDVTDGEPTRNQLDAPRTPRLARADEGNDVVREPICLYLDLGEISVAVVLHEHLQLFQFRLDRRPRPIAFGLPSGCRLARVARAGPLTLVGLPLEVFVLQPVSRQQFVAIEMPQVRLPTELAGCHNRWSPRVD